MYKAIFFDIDDTLLDFSSASRAAFIQSCDALNLFQADRLYQKFQAIDQFLWVEQKQGKISVSDVIDRRFHVLFSQETIDLDHAKMRDTFQHHLSLEAQMEAGAHELLTYLSSKYQIYAASNSLWALQHSRLNIAKLLPYFSKLFVSDIIGYEKPAPNFFQECLRQSQWAAHEVLFVGDSLEADMQGAANSKIDTCWYNPQSKNNHIDCHINHQIQTLSELMDIL